MMKRILLALFAICATYVQAQDLIVTKNGESIKVFNVDMGASAVFYQLSEDADAEIQRMPKADVLLIKKADGMKIDLTAPDGGAYGAAPTASGSRQHDAVTAIASSALTKGKKGAKTFSAKTPDGKELNYTIVSEADHTLAVTEGKYDESEYVIPDYVELDGVKYTVTEVADKAFYKHAAVKDIVFPSTLKKIGKLSFAFNPFVRIILPEGLEVIGSSAFWACNVGNKLRPTEEIYIPQSVKEIGRYCFMSCGGNLSPGGKSMVKFTSIPSFITEDNCDYYGIDDTAVRACHSRSW